MISFAEAIKIVVGALVVAFFVLALIWFATGVWYKCDCEEKLEDKGKDPLSKGQ